VTGATGVVGRLVVPHLLARGHRVTAVGRTAEKRADLAALGADAIALDLLDAGAAARAMKGHDAVIGAAGRRSWRRWSLRGDPDSAPDAVEGQATCWYTRSLSGRLMQHWKWCALFFPLLPVLALPAHAADVSTTPESAQRPERVPLRVGVMVGVVSVLRPVDVELFVRLYDRFAVGFSYSDLPNFVAGPLLSAAGANSDTMTARLDDFSAFEADLRFMPFRSAFFVGSSFGRQALKGAVTESTVVGPQTATVDATTWYVTPRAGWLWTFERGFLLGVDLGVQLKLAGSDTVTVPAGSPPEVRSKAQNLADVGTSYPLPSFHFRVGWIF